MYKNNSKILIAVEDIFIQNELNLVFTQKKYNYKNLIKDNSEIIDISEINEELKKDGDKNIILFLKTPKIILNPDLNQSEILKEDNLKLIENWIYKFNEINQNILKQNSKNKIKLLYILKTNVKHSNAIEEIINNYVFNYYEGLNIETLPYDLKFGVLFKNINEPTTILADKLTYFFNKKIKKFYTNYSKKKLKYILIKKQPIHKNKILIWKKTNTSKVAIITGASSGIGMAIGKWLVDKGWKVYSFSRSSGIKHGIQFIKCNLLDPNEINQKLNHLLLEENNIHMLINNSGYGIGSSLENMNKEDFAKMYQLNVMASMRMIRNLVPILSKNQGTIFNIGSLAGIFIIPFQVGYSLTKMLIDTYTKELINYLNNKSIKICNIMPGDTKTNFAKNRVINPLDNNTRYEKRIKYSIKQMEHDEINGHKPELIAKTMWKHYNKSTLPNKFTIGKYKTLFNLSRNISIKKIDKILYSIYAKKESN